MKIGYKRGISIQDRFWFKVKIGKPNECWEWQANCNPGGYGNFVINKKIITTHRVAWELTNGPIPKGIYVCHTCDNRKCCNPNHLFLGTCQDNINDMINKGRDKKATGERNGSAKLTNEEVLAIRELYSTGNYKQREIADMFGIHQTMISFIIRRENWVNV